jgi:4-hydroxyphenylpyruvate dioxygenase
MTDARDNPLALDGFEFVEFTAPDPEALARLFEAMGITHMGDQRLKNVRRYT